MPNYYKLIQQKIPTTIQILEKEFIEVLGFEESLTNITKKEMLKTIMNEIIINRISYDPLRVRMTKEYNLRSKIKKIVQDNDSFEMYVDNLNSLENSPI